jgi:serine/threonine protein kinase
MPHALAPGLEVSGYRIESLLGEGATGAVYLARDAEGRAVALKVLDTAVAADARFRERFLRESRVRLGTHDHAAGADRALSGARRRRVRLLAPVSRKRGRATV